MVKALLILFLFVNGFVSGFVSCSSTKRLDKLEDKMNDTRYEVKQLKMSVDSLHKQSIFERGY